MFQAFGERYFVVFGVGTRSLGFGEGVWEVVVVGARG